MNKFFDILWQGLAIIILVVITICIGLFLISIRKNPIQAFRRAYGEIFNLSQGSDANRASALRDALSKFWE